MSTLHHEKLLFNDQINISNDGGELANDAGTLLIAEFLHQIHFDQLLELVECSITPRQSLYFPRCD
ncbi:putative transposase [Ligilactobacillus acidipiscis]|nr:putative transposase [Ligilactobacillus acidipiscis]